MTYRRYVERPLVNRSDPFPGPLRLSRGTSVAGALARSLPTPAAPKLGDRLCASRGLRLAKPRSVRWRNALGGDDGHRPISGLRKSGQDGPSSALPLLRAPLSLLSVRNAHGLITRDGSPRHSGE